MSKMNKYSNVSNLFYLPVNDIRLSNLKQQQGHGAITLNHGGSFDPSKNLNNLLAPVNKPRFIQDAMLWRDAIRIAEQAVLPFRYLMQLQYMDTILDAHLKACINRREGLQLNRKFIVCDDQGNISNEWTSYFKKTWFKTFMKYSLESKWYGYTLISMGDIVNNEFKNIVMIPRTHISPDRLCVAPVPQATTGPLFLEDPYISTHIWVPTPDQHGLAACGYGLLYEVTLLTISLRCNVQYNEQFLEIFGMPYRVVHTDRTDADNLNKLEASMQLMGSLGYAIIGTEEEFEFIDTAKGGGFKGYGDLEMRLEKKISKAILGHSDAIDSAGKTPQNQNSSTGMGSSPQSQALNDIQAEDGDFLCEVINNKLFNFCRMNGINIPKNLHFEFTNDNEDKEIAKWTNEQNLLISEAVMNLAKGGIKVEPTEELSNQMGFKLAVAPIPAANPSSFNKPVQNTFKKKVVNESDEDDIDEDYREATIGFDGDEDGLTKDEYEDYMEDMQQKLEDRSLNDGPVNLHINCQCEIVNGVWITSDDCCDECDEAADEYNSGGDDE